MNIRSQIATVLLFSAAAAFAAPNTFYTTLMERGQADFASGDFQRASDELRIATFGLLDQIPQYETAQIYYALSLQRIGKKDEAAKAVLQLVQTERVAPTYRSLPIDPSVRAAFVTALPSLFTPDQMAMLSVAQFMDTSAPLAATSAIHSPAPAPRPATTTVRPAATIPSELPKDSASLEALRVQNPSSIPIRAALAEAKLREGHVSEAQQLAVSVLSVEPGNGTAHIVLGRIAAHDGRPADVISHLTAARTVRGLTDDDLAELFIAYVAQSDFANATNLSGALTDQTRQEPAVQRALARLQEATNSAAQPAKRSATSSAPLPAASLPKDDRTVSSMAASSPSPPAPPARSYSSSTTTVTRTDSAAQTQTKPSVVTTPPPPPPPAVTVTPLNTTQSRTVVPVAGNAAALREAQQAITEGKYLHARELLLALLPRTDLDRSQLLDISKGLCQVSAFRESESGYERVGRLRQGEEVNLFYKAVDFYEIGDYPRARDYLKLALPVVPMSRTVADYKAKIEATH